MKYDNIDTPIGKLSRKDNRNKPAEVDRKPPTIKDEEGKMLVGRANRESEQALANKMLKGAATCADKLFEFVEKGDLPAKLLATAMGVAVDKYIALVALTQGANTPFTGTMDANTIMRNVKNIIARERTVSLSVDNMNPEDVDPNAE